jgi:murein DD-endopeptidase MepM/ murein hydrolase activator NlpD
MTLLSVLLAGTVLVPALTLVAVPAGSLISGSSGGGVPISAVSIAMPSSGAGANPGERAPADPGPGIRFPVEQVLGGQARSEQARSEQARSGQGPGRSGPNQPDRGRQAPDRPVPTPLTPAGRWSWPLRPAPLVIRGFALGPTPWSPGHRGVDLAARPGDQVLAPANGVVSYTGVLAGRPVLSLDHGGGLVSSFEPVSSQLARGTQVRQGQPIGELEAGPGHCSPEACLHWGVRRAGQYINPLSLLPGPRGPVILLPLFSDQPADPGGSR